MVQERKKKHKHNGSAKEFRRGLDKEGLPRQTQSFKLGLEIPNRRLFLEWPWQRYFRINLLRLLVEEKTRKKMAEKKICDGESDEEWFAQPDIVV